MSTYLDMSNYILVIYKYQYWLFDFGTYSKDLFITEISSTEFLHVKMLAEIRIKIFYDSQARDMRFSDFSLTSD